MATLILLRKQLVCTRTYIYRIQVFILVAVVNFITNSIKNYTKINIKNKKQIITIDEFVQNDKMSGHSSSF